MGRRALRHREIEGAARGAAPIRGAPSTRRSDSTVARSPIELRGAAIVGWMDTFILLNIGFVLGWMIRSIVDKSLERLEREPTGGETCSPARPSLAD